MVGGFALRKKLHVTSDLARCRGITELPELELADRQRLIEHFRAEVSALEEMLGRKLDDWLQVAPG